MATNARISGSDHDLIIRLDTKFDQMAIDIKELKDGTTARLASLEQRVNAIEDIHNQLHVVDNAKRVETNTLWINNFNVRWKLVVGIASGIGTIIGLLIDVIYHVIFLAR